MATYYVSANGNDANDGLTPQSAWATTQHATATAKGGDTILLKRGDTFYGSISVPPSDDPDNPTVLGAYGVGDKPKICLYQKVNSPDAWESVAPLLYRLDLTKHNNVGGNVHSRGNNIGFLYVDGKIRGFRKFDLKDVTSKWDFYCDYDDGCLYVNCPRNPYVYGEVSLAPSSCGVVLNDNCVVSDLDIFGGGCHGIMSGHDERGFVQNVVVSRCDVHDFGGSHLTSEQWPNVRFGNGIEIWDGAANVLVEECRFYNIYDVAITMQGFPKEGKGWKNVVFRRNVMWGNMQSFEIWTQPGEDNTGMFDCKFIDNVCIGSGYCWSYDPRPLKHIGTHLFVQMAMSDHHDVLVENNVFYSSRDTLHYKSPHGAPDGEFPADFKVKNNHIFIRDDVLLMNQKHRFEASELDKLQQLGIETGSTLHILTARQPTLVTDELIEELTTYIS